MFTRLLFGTVLAIGAATSSFADTVKFRAVLAGSAEVPPTKSTGSGDADATLDTVTHQLTYNVNFKGFSSPVTMAHFHGPAAAGANAGVLVPLGTAPTSPIKGTATLTPDQQTQLIGGLWYVNVHTSNNPKGAIRGQMLQEK